MTRAVTANPELEVSLVIPARNEAAHLGACLDAASRIVGRSGLREIIVVDDGSTDATPNIARRLGARVLSGHGRGVAAARNLGITHATGELVWFLDADCVPSLDALCQLVPHLSDPAVAGVGGSYGNMNEQSLLARLIQEEIAARHARMQRRVDFLATFNVLYRKQALQELGGFDERFFKGQDAELAFRLRRHGYLLNFEPRSIVRHFHETSLASYLTVQRAQGYYRVRLYREHPKMAKGDSYSGLIDYVQPPLAALSLALLPGLGARPLRLLLGATLATLTACQLPMASRLLARTSNPRMLAYLPLGVLRAYARGAGMLSGVVDWTSGGRSGLPRALAPD